MLLFLTCCTTISTRPGDVAMITLPAILSNGAILQRDCPNNIYGTATPFTSVVVKVAGYSASTNAGYSGEWKVTIPPVSAGGPYTISIDAFSHREIKDIRFGDVWLCCGQSNMALPLAECNHTASDVDACNIPNVRFFQVADTRNTDNSSAATYVRTKWVCCSPQTVLSLSGCVFYFARSLQAGSKIPIGVIVCAANGSGLRSWLSPAICGHEDPTAPPADRAGMVFNRMLSTVIGYSVKGMIWYQGEADIFNIPFYVKKFPHMLADIRERWKQPDMPCIIVQLPNYAERDDEPRESLWAEFREAQTKLADSITNTYMIVTVDTALNEHVGLHPRDKAVIGERLALMAKAIDARTVSSIEGPPFVSMSVEAQSAVVYFDCRENRLASIEQVSGFAIAGADEHFYWAHALISDDGCSVRVWSPQVTHPCAVRYAWSDNPDANLYSYSRLPVEPFRTDNFDVNGKKSRCYRHYDFIHDIPDSGSRHEKPGKLYRLHFHSTTS